jgi:UDP-N-acetylmuramoyl-tripeptide--D-alanyl-D-alanine ligase
MGELGDAAGDTHAAIGRLARALGVDRLLVVGPDAHPIHAPAALPEVTGEAWAGRSDFVPDVDAAVELLRAQLRPEDVVLVKASRAAGLERVALALLEPAGAAR